MRCLSQRKPVECSPRCHAKIEGALARDRAWTTAWPCPGWPECCLQENGVVSLNLISLSFAFYYLNLGGKSNKYCLSSNNLMGETLSCPTTFLMPSTSINHLGHHFKCWNNPFSIKLELYLKRILIYGVLKVLTQIMTVSLFPALHSPTALKAAFDQRQCQVSLFGGDGGSGSYMCGQSIFVLDLLFNPDPSVTPSVH